MGIVCVCVCVRVCCSSEWNAVSSWGFGGVFILEGLERGVWGLDVTRLRIYEHDTDNKTPEAPQGACTWHNFTLSASLTSFPFRCIELRIGIYATKSYLKCQANKPRDSPDVALPKSKIPYKFGDAKIRTVYAFHNQINAFGGLAYDFA